MRANKEPFVWLPAGILIVAWAVAAVATYGVRIHWKVSWNYTPLLLAGALVLAGSVVAWLFYYLGETEQQKRAQMEREHRQALEEAYHGTLNALSRALDLRDDGTFGHSQRVTEYSLAIGKRLGLDKEQMQSLAWGSLLHDVGKIGIRDSIMLKPGALDDEERSQMNEHVIIGWQLVRGIPFLVPTADLIRHHHERFDGTGYPDRLAGDRIPLLARIFAVADAFDAMTSPRPYRTAPFTIKQARRIIEENRGTQFCPQVVDAFMGISLSEIEEVRTQSFKPVFDPGALALINTEARCQGDVFCKDALTGTLNRNAWETKRSQMVLTRGTALGTLVFLDLDGFKQVNDNHGHPIGDRVLADLGARLQKVTWEVYRVGGDEFTMWFPPGKFDQDTESDLVKLAGNFASDWQHLQCELTLSWGVAKAEEKTESLNELLFESDRSMYEFKSERYARSTV